MSRRPARRRAAPHRPRRRRAFHRMALVLDPDLSEYVRAAQAGDSQAWTEIIRRAPPRMRKALQQHVSKDLVEDIIQETFVRAFLNREDMPQDESITRWLLQLTTRVAKQSSPRSQRTQPRFSARTADYPSPEELLLNAPPYRSLDELLADAWLPIDPLRFRQALLGSLLLVKSAAVSYPVKPKGSRRLSKREAELLEMEGLDTAPLRPGEPDALTDSVSLATAILADALTLRKLPIDLAPLQPAEP